ncbi:HAD family hydrolase [Streptomyces sp. NPDC059008]|uniref:HAD family hydrolase n=1 Tax=Streptomyces sp. NPDC059008 TaxID=3346693 RepID=UPI0036A025FE
MHPGVCGAHLFHTDILHALHIHRSDGLATVLVSGSFTACLDPIADRILCTDLEVKDGRYTGEVLTTMIGPAKAEHARTLLTAHNWPPADCYAYGDRAFGLVLLDLVGCPVVVGSDPELLVEFARPYWQHLVGVIA